ncbi:Aste57867_10477 [Aphanomyces stellatus]|uniref:Aste57867_10477 protein n=1 Tax=Aphanomyces stellatus TaxID=120398 RepID=A0A485KQZ2_9STRA|nr:hypothetical protein As57867_010437 [Aphanomyces stellatus]VFT87351.1 Aste57867_10477 [Aphanomyces stellatus]
MTLVDDFACIPGSDGRVGWVRLNTSNANTVVCLGSSQPTAGAVSSECLFFPTTDACKANAIVIQTATDLAAKNGLPPVRYSFNPNCTSVYCTEAAAQLMKPAPLTCQTDSAKALLGWTCVSIDSETSTVIVRKNATSGAVVCLVAAADSHCTTFASFDQCTAGCPALAANASAATKLCPMQGDSLSCDSATTPLTNSPASTMPSATALPTNVATSNSLSSVTWALLGIVVLLLIGSLVFFVVYRRRRRRRRRRASSDGYPSSIVWLDKSTGQATANDSTADDFVGIKLDMGDLSLWRLDESQLRHLDVVASGAHGVVSVGQYKGQRVAIKKQLAAERTAENVQTFIDEIKLMAKLESPFIVQFIGVAWLRPREIELVVEYMEMGDLRQYLETTTPDHSFDWFPQKVQVALDIVDGLLYLHSMDIIHRDLKARNVLLHPTLRAKLTDFGIARELTDETMTQGVGTCRWTAPEVLEGNRYTVAADVYSFGMVLVELDTHVVPYMSMGEVSNFVLMERLREGTLAPEMLPSCPPALEQLARQCIAWDPTKRPSAIQVSTTLRTILKANGGHLARVK